MDTTNPYANLEELYKNNTSQAYNYLNEQRKLQENQINANTDFTINTINQQKSQAEQDLTKETKGAYTDYQKQINPYGVQAEAIANQGLGKTGYSESSLTRNYNTYQNRVSTAVQTTNKIKADFDNKISEARLSGNTDLAKLALQEYQSRMELLQQELNFQTNLTNSKVAQNNWQTEFDYTKQQNERDYQKWIQQFEYQKQQDALAQSNWEKQYNLSRSSSSGGSNDNSLEDLMKKFDDDGDGLPPPKTEEKDTFADRYAVGLKELVSKNGKIPVLQFGSGLNNLVNEGKITRDEFGLIMEYAQKNNLIS